ncbi:hypothetical protein SBRY_50165 [Actinacidiphila bryophytorum]|uniref:Uncharacterized protein n=1 Tax=Actinacidiphila bryophytorum TaxID=1436133 RepID=A0A9W4H4A1_9ACTN|nr:hypothetical protein SBRY_50165 [Actinacidiphila bryophytorum]
MPTEWRMAVRLSVLWTAPRARGDGPACGAFKPSPEAVSEPTSLLAPGDARRRHCCALPWNHTTPAANRCAPPLRAPAPPGAQPVPLRSRHVLLCSHDDNRCLTAVPRFLQPRPLPAPAWGAVPGRTAGSVSCRQSLIFL